MNEPMFSLRHRDNQSKRFVADPMASVKGKAISAGLPEGRSSILNPKPIPLG